MATPDDVLLVRDYTNEPDDTNGWPDARIEEYIDRTTTLNEAASIVWRVKAAQYATLVDVSESGSTRKLSDLRKNAMDMSAHYAALHATEIAPVALDTGPVIRRIRRSV